MAGEVHLSGDLAESAGSEAGRRAATRALTGLADSQYLAGYAGALVEMVPIGEVVDVAESAVRRGIAALAEGAHRGFPLGTQLVDLLAGIVGAAEPLAVDLAMRVLELDRSATTMVHAAAIVYRGHGEPSRMLGEYLAAVGDDRVRAALVQ